MPAARPAALWFFVGMAVFVACPAGAQVVWTVGIGKTSCGEAMRNIEKKGSAWESHYLG